MPLSLQPHATPHSRPLSPPSRPTTQPRPARASIDIPSHPVTASLPPDYPVLPAPVLSSCQPDYSVPSSPPRLDPRTTTLPRPCHTASSDMSAHTAVSQPVPTSHAEPPHPGPCHLDFPTLVAPVRAASTSPPRPSQTASVRLPMPGLRNPHPAYPTTQSSSAAAPFTRRPAPSHLGTALDDRPRQSVPTTLSPTCQVISARLPSCRPARLPTTRPHPSPHAPFPRDYPSPAIPCRRRHDSPSRSRTRTTHTASTIRTQPPALHRFPTTLVYLARSRTTHLAPTRLAALSPSRSVSFRPAPTIPPYLRPPAAQSTPTFRPVPTSCQGTPTTPPIAAHTVHSGPSGSPLFVPARLPCLDLPSSIRSDGPSQAFPSIPPGLFDVPHPTFTRLIAPTTPAMTARFEPTTLPGPSPSAARRLTTRSAPPPQQLDVPTQTHPRHHRPRRLPVSTLRLLSPTARSHPSPARADSTTRTLPPASRTRPTDQAGPLRTPFDKPMQDTPDRPDSPLLSDLSQSISTYLATPSPHTPPLPDFPSRPGYTSAHFDYPPLCSPTQASSTTQAGPATPSSRSDSPSLPKYQSAPIRLPVPTQCISFHPGSPDMPCRPGPRLLASTHPDYPRPPAFTASHVPPTTQALPQTSRSMALRLPGPPPLMPPTPTPSDNPRPPAFRASRSVPTALPGTCQIVHIGQASPSHAEPIPSDMPRRRQTYPEPTTPATPISPSTRHDYPFRPRPNINSIRRANPPQPRPISVPFDHPFPSVPTHCRPTRPSSPDPAAYRLSPTTHPRPIRSRPKRLTIPQTACPAPTTHTFPVRHSPTRLPIPARPDLDPTTHPPAAIDHPRLAPAHPDSIQRDYPSRSLAPCPIPARRPCSTPAAPPNRKR